MGHARFSVRINQIKSNLVFSLLKTFTNSQFHMVLSSSSTLCTMTYFFELEGQILTPAIEYVRHALVKVGAHARL
jgi:hypothetical protein